MRDSATSLAFFSEIYLKTVLVTFEVIDAVDDECFTW
jgi:hypothetical protein